MKSPNGLHAGGRGWRFTPSAGLAFMLASALMVMPAPVWSDGIVTSCTETNLRAAMAGGGTVTFACDGTITLGNTISITTNTVLDASGHQVTISGGNAVQVLLVASAVTLTVSNLTIADGYVVGPFATSSYGPGNPSLAGRGGGILNLGTLRLQNCVFSNNQAIGGDVLLGYGGSGQGGAIFNLGTNVIDHCVFQQNWAKGGHGGSPSYAYSPAGGGDAEGGAIYNSGSLTINDTSINGNSVLGCLGADASGLNLSSDNGMTGGSGGAAHGSGIHNAALLLLQNSTIFLNSARGGAGGAGSAGGSATQPPYADVGTGGGGGGTGGLASGALYNAGTATLVNDTVALNIASGGQGGTGGTGGLTGLGNPPWMPNGPGGGGGTGGSAYGGIDDTTGYLQMTNCTVASNSGAAGSGGSGGGGGSGNSYPTGTAGATGAAGASVGGIASTGCILANTLLASNTPSNFSGTNSDSGHNLSSDASCGFIGVGSMNNTDPKLGPLANNGGPTLTMALLSGSPAIDAGSPVGAPATDQRGVARPQGPGVDIGSFEYQYIPSFTSMAIRNATNCCLQFAGLLPNQTFTLQLSSNLLDWSAVTNFPGTNGFIQYVDPTICKNGRRFYRLKSGTP